MTAQSQKAQAEHFRQLHSDPEMLILPNVWDAASARICEQSGFAAIATTSSGLAASLGYPDGEHIGQDRLVEAVARITRVVNCPVSVDVEAGYGQRIEDMLQTVSRLIEVGAVGINIEDTQKSPAPTLLAIAQQAERIQAIRELASRLDIPLVINARTDLFLLKRGTLAEQVEQAIERAHAYLQAGADCFFPILLQDAQAISEIVRAVNGPVNVLANPHTPTLPELARLGVARISFGGGLMSSALGYLRHMLQELRTTGAYTTLAEHSLGGDFRNLFS